MMSVALLEGAPPQPAVAAESEPSKQAAAVGAAERPDLPGAQLTARVEKRRIEVLSERTETSTTYANPDGSMTVESAAGPVRVRRGKNWVPVDTALKAQGDGVRPVAVPGELRLSPGGEAAGADLVRVGSAGNSVALGWAGKLPAPRLDGPTATYPDVLPGADLVVAATRSGFEQHVLLRNRPAAGWSVTLPVRTKGLRLQAAADGELQFFDAKGTLRATAPAPRMWGASIDEHTGDPARSAPIHTRVVQRGAGLAEVVLTPDPAFLADPAVAYPVTVDPSVSMALTFDTWVQEGVSSDQSGSTELRAGTYDGSTVARSFLTFDSRAYKGTKVVAAKLQLFNKHSYSCTAAPVEIWAAGPASTSTTWSAQPTIFDKYSTVNAAKGYSSSCPAGWVDSDLTTLAQLWADNGYASNSLAVRASETDKLGWKKFNAGDAGSNIPTLHVSYNSYPTAPAKASVSPCGICTSPAWTKTTTPTLTTSASDPEGSDLKYEFQVYPGHLSATNTKGEADPGTTALLAAGFSAVYPSGEPAEWTVPSGKLADGGQYSVRVRASGGDLIGPWSTWATLTVDTVAPEPTQVSSADYTEGQWRVSGGEGTFTFTSPSKDVTAFAYRDNAGSVINTAPATITSSGATATVKITPAAGWHELAVQAYDRAKNTAPDREYTFGANAGMTSPGDGDRTAATARLGAVAPADATGVRFEYRLDEKAAWQPIDARDVTGRDGEPVSWPVPTSSDSTKASSPTLSWNVRNTLGGVDGPVQLRASFDTASTTGAYKTPDSQVTLTLDQKALGDSYASDDIGPGSVSLQTGNLTVADSDVSVDSYGSDLTLARTWNSLDAGDRQLLTANQQNAERGTDGFINRRGTTTSPTKIETSTAVADTGKHSLAIRPNGTTTATGTTYAAIGGDAGACSWGCGPGTPTPSAPARTCRPAPAWPPPTRTHCA